MNCGLLKVPRSPRQNATLAGGVSRGAYRHTAAIER